MTHGKAKDAGFCATGYYSAHDCSGSKAPFSKCGEHFRFAPASGGKADIPEPTLGADFVAKVTSEKVE